MTEQQLARMAKRRLAILRHAEEITGNVSLTCRYYGISRWSAERNASQWSARAHVSETVDQLFDATGWLSAGLGHRG